MPAAPSPTVEYKSEIVDPRVEKNGFAEQCPAHQLVRRHAP
eukprot:CAMPEP_0206333932 /NCGR_PEP_ID=MMETSP0106_2-20121207/25528_1 /ASSEMBLY_ACC=CAM_ASM_000206 /TAXON_ID=81532 /ORGANISM="Acanthoeca-like sp., Strain 10tr" /LENGTH=40 /DNA_ID= /DNA_START= /DNA_END= /DNA_ORIENTATION=